MTNLLRLLDLPAEVLELIAAGHLTEGHGRALLTAVGPRDAPPPRPRRAVQEGWSVRQTEARAREADHPRARTRRTTAPRASPHPDQVEAARRLGDALGAGARHRGPRAPRAAPATGVVVDLADPAAAEALASRLGALERA